jgi:hypothetical protein
MTGPPLAIRVQYEGRRSVMKIVDYVHRHHDQLIVTWLTFIMFLVGLGTLVLFWAKVNFF